MLCNKNECTGCFSCYNICPKQAIDMVEDRCGYIYPQINENRCINCKMCVKVCPVLDGVKLNQPKECYAGKVKDEQKLLKATSGGIATQLSEYFIDNGGVVYGVSFDKKCTVTHVRINQKDLLGKLRGSKYVHSYINETFKLAKKDLINGKKVLFIGTPCQIAGLKKYMMKEYDNLYTIDIICHGVPSQKFLKDEVKRINKSLDIDRVNFRDKKFNEFTFSIQKNNEDLFFEHWIKSPYFFTFMNSITYRENCYHCKYAQSKRCSDLTIGDFWGLGEDSKFFKEKDKGVSVMLPCTEKGNKLLKMISNTVIFESRSLGEAVNGNDQLMHSVNKDKRVEKIKELYQGDFFNVYKKVMKKHYYKQKVKEIKIVSAILKVRDGIRNG